MKRLWMVMTSAVVVVAGCASTQSPSIGITPRPGVDTTPRNTVEVLRADDKVVTRVEKPNRVSPASQPVRVAQADSTTGKKMDSGWIITVYPKSQEAMIGRFIQLTPSPIEFKGHEKLVPLETPVRYHGEGIFVARKAGNYVFILQQINDGGSWDGAYSSLSLNGEIILKINERDGRDYSVWSDGVATVTKSVKLSEGEYNFEFEFGWRRGTGWYPGSYTLELRIIEPGASTHRHLRPNEIVHYRN